MTRKEIEKQIEDAEAKLAALREELAKEPKRETVRSELWANQYIGDMYCYGSEHQADASAFAGSRLGPAERIVREFDIVDGKCVEQRDGITGRVIWREGGVARVEKPEPLMCGSCLLALCEQFDDSRGIFLYPGGTLGYSSVTLSAEWLRRAVAWVNDGEYRS